MNNLFKIIPSLFVGVLITFWGVRAAAEDGLSVTYFTDPEGSIEKFNDLISHNENFFKGADGLYHLKPGAHFVFGGDLPDRDPGSLRLTQELLRLKKESKENTVFIGGNRDLNKVRLTSELSDEAMQLEPKDWKEWLLTQGPGAQNSKVNRLKWILEKTMGAPKAFEFRREELSILQNKKLNTVSDSMVLESFEKEMAPNGSFTEFLSHVQLGHVIGNTLFVHGGITEENLGFIPGEKESTSNTGIHEWVKGLNHWYKNQFNSWQSSPRLKNAGAALVDYTRKVPGRKDNPKSTVYGKNADENGNPFLPSLKVIETLMASGITRIVVGHNPTGQTPFIMRWKDLFEVVSGDTSYSPNDTRANQITLKGKNLDTLTIESHPVGIKGLPEKVSFSIKLGEHTPIGKMLPNHSVVVAALPNGYWTYKQEDNHVYADSILSHEQVHGSHLVDPFQVQKKQCDGLIRLGRTSKW